MKGVRFSYSAPFKEYMVPIEKCKGMTIDQLLEQIDCRVDLQRQMFGQLYPVILQSEIEKIRQMIEDIKTSQQNTSKNKDAYDTAMGVI